jgi:hypothetical protein
MFCVGAMLAAGSPGRFPTGSFAHRIASAVPFADSARMPPGMPPGDAVPTDAMAVPRATGSGPKCPLLFSAKTRSTLFSPWTKSRLLK